MHLRTSEIQYVSGIVLGLEHRAAGNIDIQSGLKKLESGGETDAEKGSRSMMQSLEEPGSLFQESDPTSETR